MRETEACDFIFRRSRHSEGTFHKNELSDLRADVILANPPFNISDWVPTVLTKDRVDRFAQRMVTKRLRFIGWQIKKGGALVFGQDNAIRHVSFAFAGWID